MLNVALAAIFLHWPRRATVSPFGIVTKWRLYVISSRLIRCHCGGRGTFGAEHSGNGHRPGRDRPKANPCDDFYQYSCGTWLKNNPIPPDQSAWGRFSELIERNQAILRQILEQAAAATTAMPTRRRSAITIAACMDEKTIEAKGLAPLQPELDRIAHIRIRWILPKR